jgi:hypothetical protein
MSDAMANEEPVEPDVDLTFIEPAAEPADLGFINSSTTSS